MIDFGKQNVLGVQIDAVDYEAAASRIIQAAKDRCPYGVSALAVHGVMTGVGSEEQRYRLNCLELVVPDGQPVRWAMRLLHGIRLPDRVYGPNLMLKTCELAAKESLPIFLFGGTTDMLDRLSANLCRRFPALEIAGTQASVFRRLTAEEQKTTAEKICESGAAITFVGLGCPRQEVWAFESREAVAMPVIAVGAAFPFHAGMLPQAPEFMQRRGLEWLFRLCHEPLRLWKRYLLLNPLYMLLVGLQWLRVKSFDPDNVKRPLEEFRYG